MKFKVEELIPVLDKLKIFLAPQSYHRSIYSCMLLDDDRIVAFNGEAALLCDFPIGLEAAVPGMPFFKLINSLAKDQSVFLDLKGNGLEVRVEGKKGKSKLIGNLAIQMKEDFSIPEFDGSVERKYQFKGEGEILLEALRLCFLSSVKGVGSIMNGVALTPSGIFSSDHVRLSRHKGFKADFNELIPYDSVGLLSNLGFVPIGMTYDKKLLGMGFDGASFFCALHSIEFPVDKVNKHFEGYGRRGYKFPDNLKPALERADFFQMDLAEPARKVKIILKDEKIQLETFGISGNLKESIDCELPFDASFFVCPRFLLSVLDRGLDLYYVEGKPLRFLSKDFEHLVSFSEI